MKIVTNSKSGSSLSDEFEQNLRIHKQAPSKNEVSNSEEIIESSPNDLDWNKFACGYSGCDKQFGKKCRLLVHIRTHTGERPFECSFEGCERSYTRQFHLTRHIAVFHTQEVSVKADKHRCEICNKEYSNAYSLKKHQRAHGEERYTCHVCGLLFKKQQHLKTHTFQHTGILPYKCDYPNCGKAFAVPSKLTRHKITHIPNRYCCHYQECQEKFNTHSELIRHLGSGHPKVCALCEKSFQTLGALKKHLLTHDDSREQFFCPFTPCDRYFLEPKYLKTHIQSKHQKHFKGFLCNVCEKWLATKQKLKQHLLLHDRNYRRPIREKKSSRNPRKDKGTKKEVNLAKFLSGITDQSVDLACTQQPVLLQTSCEEEKDQDQPRVFVEDVADDATTSGSSFIEEKESHAGNSNSLKILIRNGSSTVRVTLPSSKC